MTIISISHPRTPSPISPSIFSCPKTPGCSGSTGNTVPNELTDPAACARIAEETLRRYLPDEYERQVLFDYHVGTMGSLGNQLNYTLFAAGDFRGNQIRERAAELAAGLAPPGFLPGVPRGGCTIVLSVFCVYTDNCQVDFQIEYELNFPTPHSG